MGLLFAIGFFLLGVYSAGLLFGQTVLRLRDENLELRAKKEKLEKVYSRVW